MKNRIKLRNNYDNDFEQFVRYDDMYGIAARLGFSNPKEAWDANPTYTIDLIDNKLEIVK